jgi:SAM-dependent methyltransferase
MKVDLTAAECPLCGKDFPSVLVSAGRDFEYGVTGDQEFTFVRCARCGCFMLDPRPCDESIAGLYPADYEPYRFHQLPALVRAGRSLVQRAKVDTVRRYAGPGARIVDVGCGAGGLLNLLRDHGDPSWRLLGWDYPGPHLDMLRSKGFEAIRGPIEREFVPQQVDLFILNQVVEHFPRPARVLELLAAGLAPGGHVLIETPDIGGFDARLFSRRHWGGYHIPRHMVLFDQQGLRRLAERCGLTPVESTHLASPAFWIQSLHHRVLESQLARLAPMFALWNMPLLAGVTALEFVTRTFGPTSNQRLVARKAA